MTRVEVWRLVRRIYASLSSELWTSCDEGTRDGPRMAELELDVLVKTVWYPRVTFPGLMTRLSARMVLPPESSNATRDRRRTLREGSVT